MSRVVRQSHQDATAALAVCLESTLRRLVAEWSAATGITAHFQATGLGPGRLPGEVETTICHVVWEALAIVAGRDQVSFASVVAVVRPGRFASIAIGDDGVGCHLGADPMAQIGPPGMRERVTSIGGEMVVESITGSGTTLFLRFPVPGGAAGSREGSGCEDLGAVARSDRGASHPPAPF